MAGPVGGASPGRVSAGLRVGIADPFYWEGCGAWCRPKLSVSGGVRARGLGAQLIDCPIPERETANEFARNGGLTVPEVFGLFRVVFRRGWKVLIEVFGIG